MLQTTDGSFYGTTWYEGPSNGGTVFTFSVGLRPFVETVSTLGKVGTLIKILGTDLTGATSISFDGAAAPFKVESKTLISATVPVGATSGFVTITTPSER